MSCKHLKIILDHKILSFVVMQVNKDFKPFLFFLPVSARDEAVTLLDQPTPTTLCSYKSKTVPTKILISRFTCPEIGVHFTSSF